MAQCVLPSKSWTLHIGRLPESGLAFNRMSVRRPGRQNGPFHLGFELGMVNNVQRMLKMGEGHCFASFLPILFLSRPDNGRDENYAFRGCCSRSSRTPIGFITGAQTNRFNDQALQTSKTGRGSYDPGLEQTMTL